MKRNFYLTVKTTQKEGYAYIAYYVVPGTEYYVVDRDEGYTDYDENYRILINEREQEARERF